MIKFFTCISPFVLGNRTTATPNLVYLSSSFLYSSISWKRKMRSRQIPFPDPRLRNCLLCGTCWCLQAVLVGRDSSLGKLGAPSTTHPPLPKLINLITFKQHLVFCFVIFVFFILGNFLISLPFWKLKMLHNDTIRLTISSHLQSK